MCFTISLNFILGFQPSCSLALEESPINSSISVGLILDSSISTKSCQSPSPAYSDASVKNSSTE